MAADEPNGDKTSEIDATVGSQSPPPTMAVESSAAAIGLVIANRYTLREKIGEGGMGEVWVAKQSEPVKRRVALKLIKTGMDSKAVLARFEQERQALALMDHPNIARVLDGGLTPKGQPFFVMELVNGAPLDKFCDGAKLSLRQRLELFVPICQAVQHAHQKGIVHRDLKPGNILVTIIDGKPTPKIIDFGVAKAFTGGGLTEETMTHFGAVVGTLEYMSPEQASFSGDDVDTRADIYSLGVILYELLTGLRPIDQGRLKQAALTEMVRIIREEEPSKPSTRLSTNESLPSVAALRQTEPSKLMASLRGELDWLVMKCLEKERDRRYETANGLGRDIQRYLSDEPVEARPASTGYRLQKFLKRNKGPAVALCLLMASLLAGIAGTTWGLLEANKQAEIAREAAAAKDLALQAETVAKQEAQQKAEAEKAAKQEALEAQKSAQAGIELIASVFENLDPEEVANRDRTLQELIVEQLDSAIQELGSGSIGDQRQVADLQLRLGKSLLALDQAKKALPLLESARGTFEENLGLTNPATLESMHHLSRAYAKEGQREKVMPLRQLTYDLCKQHLGEKHQDTLNSLIALSSAFTLEGDYTKATELAENAAAGLEEQLGPTHLTTLNAKDRLLSAYDADGQWDKMLAQSEALAARCEQEFGQEHTRTLDFQAWVAYAKSKLVGPEEGVKGLEAYTEQATKALGYNHSSVLEVQQVLVDLYRTTARWDEAITLAERILEKQTAKLGPDHPSVWSSMFTLCAAYQFKRWTDKALPLAEQVQELAHRIYGPDHPNFHTARNAYAVQLGEAGMWAEALPLREDVLEYNRARYENNHPNTLISMFNLVDNYNKVGRIDEAIELANEGLEQAEQKFGVGHSYTWHFVFYLTESYKSLGDLERAIQLAADYSERCEQAIGREAPVTQKYYLNTLAGLYEEAEQFQKAIPLREELLQNASNDNLRRSRGNRLIRTYGQHGELGKSRATASDLLVEIRSNHEPNSIKLASALAGLGGALLVARAYPEAVEVQRECLAIRESKMEPDSWGVAVARFKLGQALLGTGQLAEAEPLLSNGYRGLGEQELDEMSRSNEFIQNSGRDIIQDGLTDIVRLYRSYDQPEKAAKLEAELNRRLKAWAL